ncbi:Flavin monooxygenase FMO [Penicillium brevicompactum]|uniref:Flavin monooxygenase FMO n=1 Tax=Penicillium brevicompactum TaxID=5074 RepID=UPI002540C083|nr:Flavin monooxygenase FMO [Penicillium brevicompactum]KAJ5333374.1 Flavin monooxygenase FMO [Penicillium brevicompactum]
MHVERVAVIGAGPCGLGVAKYLLAEQKFKEITIFEQRNQPGGVWNYTGEEGLENAAAEPRPKPSQQPQKDVNGTFPSPVVKEYLHKYAEELLPLIRFQSLILDVQLKTQHPHAEWIVTWRDLRTTETLSAQFDAVIVANGHHNDPYIPEVAGLTEWTRAFPGSIIHSASYRRPESFSNNSLKAPVVDLRADRDHSPPEKAAFAENVPEISSLDPINRVVKFIDGREERDVDNVVFCTGYHFSVPFLSSLHPSIVTDGVRPHQLYRHVFYKKEPTLALIGFPQRIVPFPFSQAQGAWVARFLSGRVSLPSEVEMDQWISHWTEIRGDGRSFNTLAFPIDADYINSLHELSSTAVRKEGLENEGRGRSSPYWGEKEKWTRARFPLIKKASQALGDQRSRVKSLEELGFNFEKETAQNVDVSNARL